MTNLCGWMGQGTELWKTQTYFTRDYYCHEGDDVCIHLLVQWMGYETLLVTDIDYSGCMVRR